MLKAENLVERIKEDFGKLGLLTADVVKGLGSFDRNTMLTDSIDHATS